MQHGNGRLGKAAWVALAVVACLATVGCRSEDDRDTGALHVVASIEPMGSLARQIVGDTGRVDVLLPPGRSPHGFELTARQVRRLANADVVLTVGGGVDPWAVGDPGGDEDALVIEMHALIVETFDLDTEAHPDEHDHGHAHGEHDAHDHHHGPVNPHHWLDPLRVRALVAHVRDRLVERHPEHARSVARNAEVLLETIDAVHEAHRAALAEVRRRELITFHNAFDPLAERYGLRVIAHLTPIELTPGGEVTPRRLRAAVEAIEDYDLPVIYAEPQFPDRAVAALRDQTGTAVLRLDPLGHPRREGYDSWQAMMRSNLETLVDGQNR